MPITNKSDSFKSMSPAEMKGAKKIARNTWQYIRADGAECIRLHNTDVVTRVKQGQEWQTTFDSGGYRSVTTKDRMNNANAYSVYSDKGRWFVRSQVSGQVAEYFDGITLPRDFAPSSKAAAKVKREDATLKQIESFCKALKALPALPMPNGGDCWLCSMFTKQEAGGKTHDPEHLREHLRDKYIHGALIVNALRWSGLGDAGISYYLTPHCWQSSKTYITGKVRRYLKAQLGVGAL